MTRFELTDKLERLETKMLMIAGVALSISMSVDEGINNKRLSYALLSLSNSVEAVTEELTAILQEIIENKEIS